MISCFSLRSGFNLQKRDFLALGFLKPTKGRARCPIKPLGGVFGSHCDFSSAPCQSIPRLQGQLLAFNELAWKFQKEVNRHTKAEYP